MRTSLIVCWLICIGMSWEILAQDDPFGDPKPAQPPKPVEKAPFWTGAAVKLGELKKVDVHLIESPNEAVDFAVIEVGGTDPVNFLDNSPKSNVAAFVEKAEIPYAIAEEPLKVDSKVYRDRKYVIKELPEAFKGLTHLQTRAAHKAIVDSRYVIVLSTEKPAWVFLAIDERALANYSTLGAPGWLKEYSPTEFNIVTDDPIMAGTGYRVFAKKVAPGKFTLGAPGLEVRRNSMYFAFFAEEK